MKIFKDGKEIKNATVAYNALGTPDVVTVDGVSYDPAAFELKDEDTKSAKRTKTDEVMTTKSVPTKRTKRS